MKCKLCGHNLSKNDDEEEYDDRELDLEVLESCNNNTSNIVHTIEYLLICLDCKHQTSYGYLWFAICDGREHVLTSGHKLVTICGLGSSFLVILKMMKKKTNTISKKLVLALLSIKP